jgi:UDP-N-acetylmuramyl pentapeptide phosphotransferase/UDP-N-acetylglucosamine-1-phosphate transferase
MSALLALLSTTLSAVLTALFARPGSPVFVLDHPNERSLHARPIPRSGGAAILAAIAVATLAGGLVSPVSAAAPGMVTGFLITGIVFLWEDLRGVLLPLRLLAHFTAAAFLVRGGLRATNLLVPGMEIVWPGWLAVALTLLFVVWMINLYNFMDGIDGLAGSMAVVGFGTFAILGVLAGDPLFATASVIVAAAAAGFLVFNLPPARCFMGDAGSNTFGFLAAAFALWGSYQWIVPLWISLLVFSPFIVDASVTLLRRAWKLERIWEPHRRHFYQRLAGLGWGHRRILAAEILLMLFCSSAGMVALPSPPGGKWLILAVVAAVYVILMRWVVVAERQQLTMTRHGRTRQSFPGENVAR